ncbi:(2Fe-2S)-binding protein [Rhodovibrio salinarum]|uniref:NAD(FAD)-dependent dehydrogenase n=1 Tax=Rhodovibrio salinarum TaxID=1087 RepID=A0A934QLR3_9PROT|nr:(2Fe-2S)-binding protein [Rhodovibrio salinarum]MBK1699166.1 NAD(FAD)-dependent dehydrogenase [Rhodovibrio salinarum]
MRGGFRRLCETERPVVPFRLDGCDSEALAGDTVLTAVRVNQSALRTSEFGDGMRAGFCLMGACQDCWVWTRAGARLRACETPIAAGMDLLTYPPEAATWPGGG